MHNSTATTRTTTACPAAGDVHRSTATTWPQPHALLQVWYCIAPSDQAKFQRMAAGLFPEEARACADFLRHKDILISPSILRTNNIAFMQVCVCGGCVWRGCGCG